jgi:2-polyprenyl-6-methoxyphenol hydroxylase-like FAD-dependent oxidoreductase
LTRLTRAAVVGCGVGGMAAAIALARRGVEVTLFEQFETPKPLGSGLLLQPTGLAALDRLGLGEEARSVGARIERLEGHDTLGRLVLRTEYRHWRAGGYGVGIHRARLFQLIFDAVGPAGVDLKVGTTIEDIRDMDRPVLIDAQGGEHGPFDVAVIADGSASRLRGKLRPKAQAPVNPWGAVWGNLPDPEELHVGVLAQVYHRAEVMIGVLPIGLGPGPNASRLVSMFWSLPSADAHDFAACDFDAWKARVRSLWPEAGELAAGFAGAAELSPAIYRDVSVGAWNVGACVLIGDAAHGTSPQLGQGANLALLDAVELADRLAGDTSSVAVSLAGFQAARRRHTGIYQIASRLLTPLFQSRGQLWSAVRDWVFTPLSLLPILRGLGAMMLTGMLRLGPWPKDLKP